MNGLLLSLSAGFDLYFYNILYKSCEFSVKFLLNVCVAYIFKDNYINGYFLIIDSEYVTGLVSWPVTSIIIIVVMYSGVAKI